MKANGVTVAAANLGKEHTVHKKGVGEFCYETFTFTDVPAGKTLYEVVINVSNNTSLTPQRVLRHRLREVSAAR